MNFKEYTFLKEQSETHGLSKEIEQYIDNKLSNIEGRLQEIDKFGKYNVIPSGDGLLDIINIETHAVDAKLSYEGEIIAQPVVHGDKVSFAIQKGGDNLDQHEVVGLIYSLPDGQNIGTFRVEQEDPGKKYRTVIGTEQQAEPDFSDELDQQDKATDEEDDQLGTLQQSVKDLEQSNIKSKEAAPDKDQELSDLRREVELQKQAEKDRKERELKAAEEPLPHKKDPSPTPWEI